MYFRLDSLKREGEDREWDGWIASPTQWTWIWASSNRSWWRTGKPGVLQSMGLQRVRHNWATELNWTKLKGNEVETELLWGQYRVCHDWQQWSRYSFLLPWLRQPQFGHLKQSASLVGIEGQPLPSGKEDTAHGSLGTLGSHKSQEG